MSEQRALRDIISRQSQTIMSLEDKINRLESVVRDYQGIIKHYDDVRRMLSMSGDDPADYIDPIVGDINGQKENHQTHVQP